MLQISELISRLEDIASEVGDVEVTVTDGFQALCYSGEFGVSIFECGGVYTADIGIGGCLDE